MVALLEHQAKDLLAAGGLAVPPGRLIRPGDDIDAACAGLGRSGRLAVKAQVPAKNRAAAGGVVVVDGPARAAEAARALFDRDIHGHPVGCVLVERAVDATAEWFAGVLVDPWGRGLTVRCSDQGGTGVEQRLADGGHSASFGPDAVPTAAELARAWGWDGDDPVRERVAALASRLCRLAVDNDLLLLEVNPLAVGVDAALTVLDAHITVDDSAEFRQPWLADLEPELERVHPARAWRRQYGADFAVTDREATVALLNTGAGAGMLLTDELGSRGIRTYNFSDIRAGTPDRRRERFRAAVDLILRGHAVDTVLICVHAGITDLREVSVDLVESVETLGSAGRNVVVRLEGPYSAEASAALAGRHRVVVQPDLRMAVDTTAELTGKAS
ncbi:ADP-forming succinate--CoA ligase subunit beta [Rugosimonospora acidiphila]|uniref:ADP-forming succinate--CoA ligase subunit beta n=1 Tax=Rugosimonospora acidiphila TaxID=556531 RepID=A0ABP9S1N6_9ACTN